MMKDSQIMGLTKTALVIGGVITIFILAVIYTTKTLYDCPHNYDSSLSSHIIIKDFMMHAEKIWQSSVAQRHELIGSQPLSSIKPWNAYNPKGALIWWDYFYPSYNCPHQLERVGRAGDGGKWVCGLSVYENSRLPAILYSFGISVETTFEKEIISRSDNYQIYAYDHTIKKMPNSLDSEPQIHFKKFGMGPQNTFRYRTLGTLMRDNGHDWIDIIKMDVEGAEYDVLRQILYEFEDILPFGQLVIELHANDQRFEKFYRLWEELEERGLRAVHMEPNHYGYKHLPTPHYMEYVLLNVKGEKNRLIQ